MALSSTNQHDQKAVDNPVYPGATGQRGRHGRYCRCRIRPGDRDAAATLIRNGTMTRTESVEFHSLQSNNVFNARSAPDTSGRACPAAGPRTMTPAMRQGYAGSPGKELSIRTPLVVVNAESLAFSYGNGWRWLRPAPVCDDALNLPTPADYDPADPTESAAACV